MLNTQLMFKKLKITYFIRKSKNLKKSKNKLILKKLNLSKNLLIKIIIKQIKKLKKIFSKRKLKNLLNKF